MKKLYIYVLAGIIATASSCTYDFPPEEVLTSGSADFTKIVAVGNSLTAGYMNGALYDAGQAASFPNIVAQQIGSEFNQPNINAVDGYFGEMGGVVLGRLHLVGLESPAPAPIIPGQPITPYSEGKSLNNFGVPGMRIIDAGFPGYGLANPYFGRFASDPTTASVLGDAIAANGTFFTFWLGGNDVLGYAAAGATGNTEGNGSSTIDMTPVAMFSAAYSAAISAMTANGAKGIVANVPSVQDIPHFTTVPWNAIPMDAATAEGTNAAFAGLNGVLEALKDPGFGLNADDLNTRKVFYSEGNNPITMLDENLVDLGPYYDMLLGMGAIDAAQRAGLEPYRKSRPMTSSELVTLTAGSVLGTLADPTNPSSVIGVGVPLAEKYTLTLADQETIANRVADFNAAIADVVASSNGNLVLLDINSIFAEFVQKGASINGAGMDATILPPFGAFSLDGVHPNQRGSAWIASLFIDTVNEAFGSNIPNVNPNNWPGNELPVP